MRNTANIVWLFVLLLFLSGNTAKADDQPIAQPATPMFFLDWDKMPLDSVMPTYSEVIPLESDYRLYEYKVNLLYPEWKEMTTSETIKMQQWKDSITSELRINTIVGVMRGEGLLDVCFIPVILRDGKFLKLISAKMEICAVEKSATVSCATNSAGTSFYNRRKASSNSTDRYTRTSKLAEGKWQKISVSEDGIYRLTRSSLQQMGFKNPQNVHLYGYGGYRLSEVSQPDQEYDDLQEVPLYQADNDTWLFWGNGLVYWDGESRIFNPYATSGCYFLTEEETPSSIETLESSNAANALVIESFTDHLLYEKDDYAWFQGGRNLVESTNYAQSNSHTYRLTLPSESLGNERLTVTFTAGADEITNVTPTVNGTSLSGFSVAALSNYIYGTSNTRTYDVSQYKTGADWNIKLTSTSGHDARLDYLALHYLRSISPGQTFVAFTGVPHTATTFRIADSDCKVMRIGQPGSPAVMINTVAGDNGCSVSVADGSPRFVCFKPSYAYPQPKLVGTVQNQNLHALDSLDMVIIIPESGKLQAQAERLAEAHAQYDHLRVKVVRADEVYNEFSSGTPDATAYRRFMKMLYDRANGDPLVMPRYLLLMGDCYYDNRLLTSSLQKYDTKDLLLCFESENSFSDTKSYVMEDYFGLLDDGEGSNLTRDKVDLAVGRFPVKTEAEAMTMVDKVINFISNENAGSWKNVVMMLGDDGDNNSHMKYCDDVAERIIEANPEMEVKKLMWDAYTRVSTASMNTYPDVTSLMKKQLEDGVMVMNYTGHGATYTLSHEYVWFTSDFQDHKGSMLPLWFTAACDIMPFDTEKTNQGVEAVLNEGGGALAFLGTTRTVYASNNWQLNRFFSQYLFATDTYGRRYSVGDALRLTKCSLVGSESSNLENKLQYCLLGDPALVIGAPRNRVRLESITNAQTGEKATELKAGMPVKLEGQIVSENGGLLSGFDGVITANVYDSMDTITCKNNDRSADEAFVFTDRSSVLYTGQDSVRSGKFCISFVVPKDIKYSGGLGRIVFYAINQQKDVEANGYDESFSVGGTFETTDTIGPKIELTLNGEYGGTVNSTPYLCARLSDESGINVTGNGIGHNIELMVDNNPVWTYVLNDYYVPDFGDFRQGTLSYTIPSLPAGPHTLSLRAWDLMNNTSVSQLDFEVDPSYEPTILHLAASHNPAVTDTDFLLTYDLPGTVCYYTIEVFDFAGRRIWMHEGRGSSSTGQFVIPWDLRVGAGYGRICSGIYIYRATLTSGESKLVTKSQKLIVH